MFTFQIKYYYLRFIIIFIFKINLILKITQFEFLKAQYANYNEAKGVYLYVYMYKLFRFKIIVGIHFKNYMRIITYDNFSPINLINSIF